MVGARLGLELVINSASIASLFLALSPALCLFAASLGCPRRVRLSLGKAGTDSVLDSVLVWSFSEP